MFALDAVNSNGVTEDKPMKLRMDGKTERQKEAKERQAIYNKLTPKQKIAKLDKMFGKGVGAKKDISKAWAKAGDKARDKAYEVWNEADKAYKAWKELKAE